MIDWFVNNVGTLAVLAVVACAVAIAVAVIGRDKKKGVSSCGGSCGTCGMRCHGASNDRKE